MEQAVGAGVVVTTRFLAPIGQNVVTWSDLAVGDAGKCSLYSRQPFVTEDGQNGYEKTTSVNPRLPRGPPPSLKPKHSRPPPRSVSLVPHDLPAGLPITGDTVAQLLRRETGVSPGSNLAASHLQRPWAPFTPTAATPAWVTATSRPDTGSHLPALRPTCIPSSGQGPQTCTWEALFLKS